VKVPGAGRLRQLATRIRRPGAVPVVHRRRTLIIASVPVVLVAAIAGIVSYNHIVALGLRTYQGQTDAHLLPVAVDGLIVAGSVILAFGSSLGWLSVSLGVAATLFANLQYGLPHGRLSAVVSTWPAVAFTVATFALERWLRSQRRHSGQSGAEGAHLAPYDSLDAAIGAMLATATAGNPLSGRQLEARFGLKRGPAAKVRELVLASMNGNGSAGGTDEHS
jgi:hypothetical protein